MRASLATSKGNPRGDNEDFIAAVSNAVVLLDGAGISGIEDICRHGVAWHTHRLGGALIGRLSREDGRDLRDLLGEAIEEVTDDHRDTCDVTDPSSPSATVALLRVKDGSADYLVLSDSFLLLEDRDGTTRVVTDDREVVIRQRFTAPMLATAKDTPEYERVRAEAITGFRATRNQPGGFWVAKNDPAAAQEAVVGSVPTADLISATLLSNGASRIVDRFGLTDWPGVVAMLGNDGPAAIIKKVREAEANSGQEADDATIAYCELRVSRPGAAVTPRC
jgi:Protein phosphatase 2C